MNAMYKRDDVGSFCMKNHDGQQKMKLVGRLKLCKQYCESLLKDKNLWYNTLELKQNVGTVEEIINEEVKKAMSKIKKVKHLGHLAANRSGSGVHC